VSTLSRFLERCGFHLPFLHDWLDERDNLRRKTRALTDDLEIVHRELAVLSGQWMPPGHFYSPIPSIPEIEMKRDSIFHIEKEIPGIDLKETRQLELLDHFLSWYEELPFPDIKTPGHRYWYENPNYSYSDAIVLYSMMRYLRPKRIVEVGSGYSSCAMLDVDELFLGKSIEFTFIEPYPERLLLNVITDSDRSRLKILDKNVQDVELGVFRKLGPGDILFIDSSHVSKTGSDVNYLLFTVFPVLKPGVFIHVHDIFHPFEYPPEWVFEGRAWNEAYLLRAFLTHNKAYEIQFFTSYVFRYFLDRIESQLPLMLKCPGGGIWLTKNGNLNAA